MMFVVFRGGEERMARFIHLCCLTVWVFFIFPTEVFSERLLDVPYFQQPDGSTCMPASLLMALDYFGKDQLSKERIFELHRRTRVNRLNIPAILEDYGLDGDASYSPYWTFEDIKQDIDDGLPVILGTDISDAGHIMLAVGYTDDGKVIVNDPGYQEEGNVVVTLEEVKFDGGGIRFRKVPPGPYQAQWVAQNRFRWIEEHARKDVWIEYLNRGTEVWPAHKVELRPTLSDKHQCSFFDLESWVSANCIARTNREIKPGEKYRFEFSVIAPDVTRPTYIYQPFHLALAPDTPFSYPRDQDVGIDVRIWPIIELPVRDSFPATGPELPWIARFTEPICVERPDAPGGDSTALRVLDPEEAGYESIRIGSLDEGDYCVSATIYCPYRPELESQGFERVGIFARDRYSGGFDSAKRANCYLMAFDSHDGRIHCAKTEKGVMTDFLDEVKFLRSSGWHEFSITCRGNSIEYFLDGERLLQVNDDFRSAGQAGVGYHEYFSDNTLAQGTFVAKFSMLPLDDS